MCEILAIYSFRYWLWIEHIHWRIISDLSHIHWRSIKFCKLIVMSLNPQAGTLKCIHEKPLLKTPSGSIASFFLLVYIQTALWVSGPPSGSEVRVMAVNHSVTSNILGCSDILPWLLSLLDWLCVCVCTHESTCMHTHTASCDSNKHALACRW